MFEGYEIIGNGSKDLLLKGKGQVKIQWGSKFIDLIKDGKINTGALQINTVNTISDIGKVNGFYYVESNSSIYVVINSETIPIVDGDNSSYVSYLEQSNISDTQRLQALKNIGFVYDTKTELSNLKFDNSIVYCQEDQQLYIVDNGTVTKFNSTITTHATTADEATKLTTPRNIWGQSFDGTKDITGDQTIKGSSTVSGDSEIKGNQYIDKTLEIGNFQESVIGSGARVLPSGAAEFESIFARSSISAPEFTFNRITVNYGETWCTNGYGTVKDVVIDSNNSSIGTVFVKIEDGDYMSVEVGDICRGIFSDGFSSYDTTNGTLDIQGFEVYNLLFTSYFKITSVSYVTNSFKYELKDASTKHPCKYMKFAQYGNVSTDSTRCSSIYTNTLNHPYTICLDKVGQYFSNYNYTANDTPTDTENQNAFDPFTIYPYNLVKIDGYLGGRKINVQDGTVKKLQGYGLYVQNNVYLGGALIEFDAQTLASIQNKTETILIFDKVISLDADSSNKTLEDFTSNIAVTLKIGEYTCSNLSVDISSTYITFDGTKFVVSIPKGTSISQQTIPFTITGKYGNDYTCTVNDNLLIIPNKSSLGLYDMGNYVSTTEYTNDGQWAPMVKCDNDYYYLNYIGNVIGQVPSLASIYWKQMSRLDAIYASILMADYATIDKAVFKSGYMFSQQGIANNANSTNYQTFDPTNLSIFNPNFYIDFLTGKVKCSNIEVTGGTFSIGDNFSVDYSGNLVAQNATLSGDITANKVLAATGSFSSLTCVNSSGSSNIGTLQFGNNGALWWSGDLYMNGSRTIGSNTRSLRFFAQDLWCRGSFGSIARNLVKIVGNTAYYYSFGTDSTEHLNVYTTVNLESKITSTGETYYNIPCYGNSYFQDASGMPIDTVVFATPNTDTTTYNYNIQLFCSQRVTLFNACDDKSANIYIRGNNFEIKGGSVIILQNFKTFLINEATGTVGEGHVLFINTDNNWPH